MKLTINDIKCDIDTGAINGVFVIDNKSKGLWVMFSLGLRHLGIPSLLFSMILLGCGTGSPVGIEVSGEVKLDGKPLSEGIVRIMNTVTGEGLSAKVADGHFRFSVLVFPGDYRLAVQPPSPEGNAMEGFIDAKDLNFVIPEHYQSLETSGLKATIDHRNPSLQLNLESEAKS